MADTAAETTETATTETTAPAPAAESETTAPAAEEAADAAHTPTDQPDTSDAPDSPSESAAGGDSGGTADAPAAAGLADALGAGDAETVTEATAPAAEPATAPEPAPAAEAPAETTTTTAPAPVPLARDIVDITPLADLGITDTTSLPDALQALATAVTTATENRAIDTLAAAHGIPHAAARDSISLRDAIHTGDQAKIQAAIQGISQRVIGTRGASTIETALAGAAAPAPTGPVSTLSALESALSGQAH